MNDPKLTAELQAELLRIASVTATHAVDVAARLRAAGRAAGDPDAERVADVVDKVPGVALNALVGGSGIDNAPGGTRGR